MGVGGGGGAELRASSVATYFVNETDPACVRTGGAVRGGNVCGASRSGKAVDVTLRSNCTSDNCARKREASAFKSGSDEERGISGEGRSSDMVASDKRGNCF